MLYQFLSFMCRVGVVAFVLVPIVTVELAPEHFIGYLFGVAFSSLGVYLFNKLADFFEKPKKVCTKVVSYSNVIQHEDTLQQVA